MYSALPRKATPPAFLPCTNCPNTMRLAGVVGQDYGIYQFYSCPTCGDAIDLALALAEQEENCV